MVLPFALVVELMLAAERSFKVEEPNEPSRP